MEVDPAVRPEFDTGKIRDDCTRRYLEPSPPAQRPEDTCGRGIGGDDEVRAKRLEGGAHASGAECCEEEPSERSERSQAKEQEEEQCEQPRKSPELNAVGVAQQDTHERPEQVERVEGRHVRAGRSGAEIVRDGARGGEMAFADVRREDYDSRRGGRHMPTV
jgi:hypothetical protein